MTTKIRISSYGSNFVVQQQYFIPLLWFTHKIPITTCGITRYFPKLFKSHQDALNYVDLKVGEGKYILCQKDVSPKQSSYF